MFYHNATLVTLVREAPFWNVLFPYGHCPKGGGGEKASQDCLEHFFFHVRPFDRGGWGLKLFGQFPVAHIEQTHFKKGLPLPWSPWSVVPQVLKSGSCKVKSPICQARLGLYTADWIHSTGLFQKCNEKLIYKGLVMLHYDAPVSSN